MHTGSPSSFPPSPTEVGTSDLLADVRLQEVLGPYRREVQRARQVFVNRNLRMSSIELVGFDMDYTLAVYRKRSIEQLSFALTLERMIAERGYPDRVRSLVYDPTFVMRGLAVDRATGNLLKMDRYRHVGRAYHGRALLPPEEKRRLYRGEKIDLKSERFAWIDTLFALPEACLYAELIETIEAPGRTVDYDRLYIDIRECIDAVHRDGPLKEVVRRDLSQFIARDPELGPTLHKLRSGGKKLFLLTNSTWDYTDAVMSFLLDGSLPEYASWRHYFDIVVCSATKPSFFSQSSPFLEIDLSTGKPLAEARSLERGHAYEGGNLADFERLAGIAGDKVLYVGDHIYGDILRSKKSSLWRTCMIIEELEDEISYTDRCAPDIVRLSSLEAMRARLDDEINTRKLALNSLERRLEREDLSADVRRQAEDFRRHEKLDLDKLRRALKDCGEEIDTIERRVETGFNGTWGLTFKEGTENSRFGEQVEQYACIYTSRVSNLLAYSPMQYFRSPRDYMPHERMTGTGGRGVPSLLSPLGSEGPPKGSAAS